LTNDNILIQNIDVQDAFNPISYGEFKRQRSKSAKDVEQKTLETEFEKPDHFRTHLPMSLILAQFITGYL
jgi:hypothetical protein